MLVQSRLLTDRSDLLMIAAIALLPVDGTVLGIYAPFWTPISPWLFLLYVVTNWRLIPAVYHRFRMFFWLPVALIALSVAGWTVFGFHLISATESLMGIIGALACLVALDIALVQKRLDWRRLLHILIAAYWFAFAVGVVQWLAIHLDIQCITDYFASLMARQYINADSPWGGERPQFLFAEPSYIGMHLYGVLLPLMWLMRHRDSIYTKQLRNLILVFAIGSIAMGAGTRIVLDSIVALIVVIVERMQWRNLYMRLYGIAALLGVLVLGAISLTVNKRLSSIIEQGMTGDGSFYARIYHSLGPLIGLIQHPWTLCTGFGAGNISNATQSGSTTAMKFLKYFGGNSTGAANWYASVTSENVFTMSAWTSYLTEFGILGIAMLGAIILQYIIRATVYRKTLACWAILILYLYVQFEGYAFYALPLLLWYWGKIFYT